MHVTDAVPRFGRKWLWFMVGMLLRRCRAANNCFLSVARLTIVPDGQH